MAMKDEAMDERDGSWDAEPPPVERTSALGNAPWWLISAGLHAVILLGTALVYVERLMAVEASEIQVVSRAPREFIKEPENIRDITSQKGLPLDDGKDFAPSTDPVIFYPDAEIGDHNVSDDHEMYDKMKGDSENFLSYIKGQAGGFRGRQVGTTPGVYDTMGVGSGGGGGGRYGGRFGGNRKLRVGGKGGPTPDTESAVIAALKWLAHHQNPDGSWGAEGFSAQCTGGRCSGAGERDFDTGVSALSLLAFLGAGYSHLSRDEFPDPIQPDRTLKFGEVVKKSVQWLISHQDPEGCIGERGQKYMYNHAIAALALSEAYGMTAAQPVRQPAQKAIDFVVASQNPGKGWRYSSKSGDNDSSVTGWAVMALKSAELSELQFPRSVYDGPLSWFGEVMERNYYRVGYTQAGQGKVIVPGKNESWDDHPSMSAVAVMSRIFMQKDRREPALGAVSLLVSDLPEWKTNRVDFYYWYYASLALFQYDGPEGPMWKKWNEPMKTALVPNQHMGKGGCRNGSWDPEGDRWGFEGGRVYSTAINALTLEVYYRYTSVFGGGNKAK
jgi:hypothetical protein